MKPVLEAFPAPDGDGPLDLLVVAGEHSGDEHAARLVRGMLRRDPKLRIAALGGPQLREAGAQLLFEMTSFSVVGLREVIRHYGFFRGLFRQTVEWIATHRPRAVCLVDYPGFNLRLAKALFQRGLSRKGGGEIGVCAYISPQVWAWKAKRRFKMERWIDELGVIFPFEVDVFRDTRLPTFFVGHPFVYPDHDLAVSYDSEGPVLLLPGSRVAPVKRIFPVLLQAWRAYRERSPEARATVLYPGGPVRGVLEAILGKDPADEGMTLRPISEKSAGCAVLTSSGTMSLQCALAGLPGAIVYRADRLTYAIGRRLVRIPYLGIANILLDRPVYPEYLQSEARPEKLAAELMACVHSGERRQRAAEDAEELRHLLSANRYLDADAWVYQFATGRSPGGSVWAE
jgi:lipid-A-disaccharide synthase